MRLTCVLTVLVVLAFAARARIRDRRALRTAAVFAGAYMAGWEDALRGLLDDDDGQIGRVHHAAQLRAAREGRQ